MSHSQSLILLQLKTVEEKECTTECKSQRRLDEIAPWALNFGSGEGGDDEKGRRGAESSQPASSSEDRAGEEQWLGLVALAVGPVHIRMRARKERASEGSVCGRAIAAACR